MWFADGFYGSNPLKNRNDQYIICENFFRFWYRFVFANRGAIEGGQGALNYISDFIAKPAFEVICAQYLSRLNKLEKLPSIAKAYEKWWGNDKETGTTNIDIVVPSAFDNSIILGECKWKNSLKQVKKIEKLLNKGRLIKGKSLYYYYFFSKIPYSMEAKGLVKINENLKLLTLDDLFEI